MSISRDHAPQASAESVQDWFSSHITLSGKPYALDLDQARAVCDQHQNTLVTARAGSGKTRVIVAKVAYLVSQGFASLNEIAIFMFNRTAAAEVNQRIAEVKVDGSSLCTNEADQDSIHIASTFHKFALDIVKKHGEKPTILSEDEQEKLVQGAFRRALGQLEVHLPPQDYQETFSIVQNFITRAEQKYPGLANLSDLKSDIEQYISCHSSDASYEHKIFLHRTACLAYQFYLRSLVPPKTDFNLLTSRATEILRTFPEARAYVGPYKYLMIDEYQDFSYLFFGLVSALRRLYPTVKIFAVGDDWQAINRFAGSDVDYFINFQKYFPEDYINIPLATNYRSCRKIVETANSYMLKNYDPMAVRAMPWSRHAGRVRQVSLQKVKYNLGDYFEDKLGDGRFIEALVHELKMPANVDQKALKNLAPSVKLLKSLLKIFLKHRNSEIMLLHRHNFTSVQGVTLEVLLHALKEVVVNEKIMGEAQFDDKVRCMTMHKSKGLESEIVILLEMEPEIVKSHHPHATIFEIFGDTLAAETADQDRLIYVALTRAKERLYLVSSTKFPLPKPK